MARPGYSDHPKCIRFEAMMAALLPARMRSLAPPLARGIIERIWDVAYGSGDPIIGHPPEVAAIAGWHADPADLVRMLTTCGRAGQKGLLEEVEPDVYAVHDLFDHAPRYVKRRLQREIERKEQGRLFTASVRSVAGQTTDAGAPLAGQWPAMTGQRPPGGQPLDVTPAPAPAPAPIQRREDAPEDGSAAGGGTPEAESRKRANPSAKQVASFEDRWVALAGPDGPPPPPPARIARMRKEAGGIEALLAVLDHLGIDGVCRGADYVHQAARAFGQGKQAARNGAGGVGDVRGAREKQRRDRDAAAEQELRERARARAARPPMAV